MNDFEHSPSCELRQDAAVAFLNAMDGYLASDIARDLTCIEVDLLAKLFVAFGMYDEAKDWINCHADHDDEGDAHYREPQR